MLVIERLRDRGRDPLAVLLGLWPMAAVGAPRVAQVAGLTGMTRRPRPSMEAATVGSSTDVPTNRKAWSPAGAERRVQRRT